MAVAGLIACGMDLKRRAEQLMVVSGEDVCLLQLCNI